MALGLAPAIGFLHNDRRGRWSLAWDAIEPLRPAIEARVFRLVEAERFAVSDFVRAPDGSLRLAPALLAMVLNEAAPPHAALAQCVRWLARLVLSSADEGRTRETEDHLRQIEGFGLAVGGGSLRARRCGAPFIGPRGERR